MRRVNFRLNNSSFSAYVWNGVWCPPEDRGKITSFSLTDNGGNPARAETTFYLLRKWFIGKPFSKLEEIIHA